MSDDTSVPVITVDLDWAGDQNQLPRAVNGLLVVKTGSINGWPTYRVTAPVDRLVAWLAESYLGQDGQGATDLGQVLEGARFAKMADFQAARPLPLVPADPR
jgi:hypothetical protein